MKLLQNPDDTHANELIMVSNERKRPLTGHATTGDLFGH